MAGHGLLKSGKHFASGTISSGRTGAFANSCTERAAREFT